ACVGPEEGRAGSAARGGGRPTDGSGRVGDPRRVTVVPKPGNGVGAAPPGTGTELDTLSGPCVRRGQVARSAAAALTRQPPWTGCPGLGAAVTQGGEGRRRGQNNGWAASAAAGDGHPAGGRQAVGARPRAPGERNRHRSGTLSPSRPLFRLRRVVIAELA